MLVHNTKHWGLFEWRVADPGNVKRAARYRYRVDRYRDRKRNQEDTQDLCRLKRSDDRKLRKWSHEDEESGDYSPESINGDVRGCDRKSRCG